MITAYTVAILAIAAACMLSAIGAPAGVVIIVAAFGCFALGFGWVRWFTYGDEVAQLHDRARLLERAITDLQNAISPLHADLRARQVVAGVHRTVEPTQSRYMHECSCAMGDCVGTPMPGTTCRRQNMVDEVNARHG